MTIADLLKKPSAFAPLMMSSLALLLVGGYVITSGTAPQVDEGAAAHVWQLLMAIQVVVIAYFAMRWLPLATGPTLAVLAIQVGALLVAAAPVFILGF